jgi:4-amino-4-deoxy-L-arabinose transferase-like glycosyltransferase
MKFLKFFFQHKSTSLLILIIIFAFFLRFYKLGDIPFGFFCDEASVGYNAYSLLKHGTDEWGTSWPVFFKAFGEFKGPVMIYSSVPIVSFLGLNEFSVRLVSVIYGVATIFVVYLLVKQLFNQSIALLSSFFLAISPWHIHFSRVSLEGLTPFVFFTVLASYFWLKFLKNYRFGYLSILFFSLAFYSYFPARIFIPLFFITLLLTSKISIKKNFSKLTKLFIFGLILITPMIFHLINGNGLSRWQQVKGDSDILSLSKKYFEYFSTDFLFFQGDIDFSGQFVTRHSVRGIGELYLIQLPLIIIALFFLIKDKSRKKYLMLLFWILLYPFCDLFTSSSSPQATRSIIGVIPFQILTAVGIFQLFKFIKNKTYKIITAFVLFLLIICSVNNYQKSYYQNYILYSSDYWGWQSGPKEIINYFRLHQQDYDQLCLEGKFNAPEIFIKFYDPKNLCQGKCQVCGIDRLNINKKQLFAVSTDTFNQLNQSGFKVKKTIYYPNRQPAFYFIDFN